MLYIGILSTYITCQRKIERERYTGIASLNDKVWICINKYEYTAYYSVQENILISDKNVNCVYYSVVQRERKLERTREIARFVTGYFLEWMRNRSYYKQILSTNLKCESFPVNLEPIKYEHICEYRMSWLINPFNTNFNHALIFESKNIMNFTGIPFVCVSPMWHRIMNINF